MDDGVLGVMLVTGVLGIIVQYFLIKSAVQEALKKHEDIRPKDKAQFDNLIIALGMNPAELHAIDNEASKVYFTKLKNLKKDKIYRNSSVPDQWAAESKLKAQIAAEFNERKLQLRK